MIPIFELPKWLLRMNRIESLFNLRKNDLPYCSFNNIKSTTSNSIAIGYNSIAIGYNSIAIGSNGMIFVFTKSINRKNKVKNIWKET